MSREVAWGRVARQLSPSTEAEQMAAELEIIDLSDDELAAFRTATEPVIDMVRSNIGDDLVDSLLGAVESSATY